MINLKKKIYPLKTLKVDLKTYFGNSQSQKELKNIYTLRQKYTIHNSE